MVEISMFREMESLVLSDDNLDILKNQKIFRMEKMGHN